MKTYRSWDWDKSWDVKVSMRVQPEYDATRDGRGACTGGIIGATAYRSYRTQWYLTRYLQSHHI